VQGELHYAIVDEVDSILVDEARTPLIISGVGQRPTHLYEQLDRVVRGLQRETDYIVDEKAKTAVLTDQGMKRAERALNIDNLSDPRTSSPSSTSTPPCGPMLLPRRRGLCGQRRPGHHRRRVHRRLLFGRRYSEGCTRRLRRRKG